jgi:hypothetical protein
MFFTKPVWNLLKNSNEVREMKNAAPFVEKKITIKKPMWRV